MYHRLTLRAALRFLPVPLALLAPAAAHAQVGAAPLPPASSNDPVERLSRYLRELSVNPRSLDALSGAGHAALDVGDPSAAVGFFARAQEAAPRDGRVKAGLAAALVQLEQPRDALRLFDQARDLGVPEGEFAADRGLAYDLRGDGRRAQEDYRRALVAHPGDPEATRRLALSMAMSGDRAGALAVLDPLLRKQDRAAWRASTFVLAMTGDTSEADTRVGQLMVPAQAQAMRPFLDRLAKLSPAEQAAAVHFGHFPTNTRGGRGTQLASANPPRRAPTPDRALVPGGAPFGIVPPAATVAAQPAPIAVPSATTGPGFADAFAARDPQSRASRRRPGQADAVSIPSARVPAVSSPGSASAAPGFNGAGTQAPTSVRFAGAAPVASRARASTIASTLAPSGASPGALAGSMSPRASAAQASPLAGRVAPIPPFTAAPVVVPAPSVAETATTHLPAVSPIMTPRGAASGTAAPAATGGTMPTTLPSARAQAQPSPARAPLPGAVAPAGRLNEAAIAAVSSTSTGATGIGTGVPAAGAALATAVGTAAAPAPGLDAGRPADTPVMLADAGAAAIRSFASAPVTPAADVGVAATQPPVAVQAPSHASAPEPRQATPAQRAAAAEPAPPASAARTQDAQGGTRSRAAAPPSDTPAPAAATAPARRTRPAALEPGAGEAEAAPSTRRGAKAAAVVDAAAPDAGPAPVKAKRGARGKPPAETEEDAPPKLSPREAKAKALADAKAAREAKEAKATALADAKAAKAAKAKEAEAKRQAKLAPERYWVQVAGGANKSDLPKAWAQAKEKHPELAGKTPHTTPLRFTNRLLVGPFKSADEAQSFVNKTGKSGWQTFTFTSPAGQKVEPIAAK